MKKFLRTGFGALVLILAVSVHAWQVAPQPFSSDLAMTTKNGQKMSGKYYFAPPKQRMDISAQGHDSILITDAKTQTSDILMPQQHMYIETRGGQASPLASANMPKIETNLDPSNPCAARPDVTCKKLGPETVNGRVCDKWEFTDKKGNTTTAWVDQKLHFPIKTHTSDGALVEFTNIKEGAPSASVFEIPADYRKLDMGSMGGRIPQ